MNGPVTGCPPRAALAFAAVMTLHEPVAAADDVPAGVEPWLPGPVDELTAGVLGEPPADVLDELHPVREIRAATGNAAAMTPPRPTLESCITTPLA